MEKRLGNGSLTPSELSIGVHKCFIIKFYLNNNWIFLPFQPSDDKDELIKNEEIDPGTAHAVAKKKKYLGKINYKVI